MGVNVFDLFAKISLDDSEYNKKLDDAGGKSSSLFGKLKSGLGVAGKAVGAAISAAATGIGVLTKSSMEGYANYEQLTGGVETLFKESADTVIQYADNAYKTAGMNANEYMETVTSFSASLLQSLEGDTEAAAEKANVAITDMADNANKMGSSMESIQNAYQGFAKQNYTMLDNLKLGYGGTKEEMQRLLEDAEKLSGQKFDLSSYADVVDAIHVIQTEMGIAGATADEASGTIQGSIGMMKSAWQNFLTGMADPSQDFGALVGNLIDSVVTVGDNIIPRIQELLPRLTEGIAQLAQSLLPYIPETLDSLLPTLIEGSEGLIGGFVEILPALITTALTALPQLLEAGATIISNLISALVEAAPQLLEVGVQLLDQLTTGIENGLPDMIARLPQIIEGFLGYITENLPAVLDKGMELLDNLLRGILNAIPVMLDALPQVITAIVNFLVENFPKIVQSGAELLGKLIAGIIGAIPELVAALPQIIVAIVSGIGDLMHMINDLGKNIIEGLWEGIQSMGGWIGEKVSGFFKGIVSGAKKLLGINSPSRVFAEIGGYMAEGLGSGWDGEYDRVKRQIEGGMHFGTATVDFDASGMGASSAGIRAALSNVAASIGQDINITVQSILEGKVIGETSYRYCKNRERMFGE